MRQSEKIKYMLTTELTEDELKNVIHYSFSNKQIKRYIITYMI